MNPQEFDEYLRQSEPHRSERAQSWKTAIGLQAVDGLKPSSYLLETARRHIEGDISIEEVKSLIDSYYQTQTSHTQDSAMTEEADKVSANIAELLNEKTFTFSPMGYISIHRRIFNGVFKFAGSLRDYNISKKEWVLRGDTVLYASAAELRMTLDYDFAQEARFDYRTLSPSEMIVHFARFISGLWQIHPFGEGNTRTTAVFAIKYLRSMGFDVNNDLFAAHSWYFRNALVRANYRNYQKKVEPDFHFLEQFFRNLLLGEQNELKNRYLLIQLPENFPASTRQTPGKHPTSTRQVPDKFSTGNSRILDLIRVLGDKELSLKELLVLLSLKDRESFRKSYLDPAIQSGFVRSLYPDSPRHPRQKYLLTEKGQASRRSLE
ncbi:MAG: Fic family protein [Victivallales bacterium]|nr:Fic family protein [Victivallales bacterium]